MVMFWSPKISRYKIVNVEVIDMYRIQRIYTSQTLVDIA